MSIHLDPDKCVGCSACVVHCPVAQATPKFLGPRLSGPALERMRLLGVHDDPSLTYCANCKNCEIACPHNVPIATINMLARQAQAKETPPSFRDWICAHGEVIANLTKYIPAGLKNWSIKQGFVRQSLDFIGIAKQCPMPSFAQIPFREHIRKISQTQTGKAVIFFPGCYINYYDPGTGFDLVAILQACDYQVYVPEEFVCCGIPLISGGFEDDARHNAIQNAKTIAKYANQGLPIITACPSCRLMLTTESPEFFPEVANDLSKAKIYPAEDFILQLIATSELNLRGLKRDETLDCIYHAPCHLRAQGEGLPGYELLSQLPGINMTLANAGCCGISGSYGFKKEKYAIGQMVGHNLFQTINDSPAKYVATECGTCRLQISGATKKPVLHPLTLVRAILEQKSLAY